MVSLPLQSIWYSKRSRHASAELYSILASLDEESGQYVEAVQSYQRAVELDPNNEQYYFDLGMEYLSHFTFEPKPRFTALARRSSPNLPGNF